MAGEVGAIVLAAGRATRFGASDTESKVLALLEGRPLVTHVATTALASQARPVIVVTGQGAAGCASALAGLDVLLAHNPAFAAGMAGSLRTGLAALPPTSEAAVVLLADMPRVRATTIDALAAAFMRERGEAVVPVHAGRRGNPVIVSRSLFPALASLTGDEGARRVLADPARRVTRLPVDDPGILADVDTPDALAALARAPY